MDLKNTVKGNYRKVLLFIFDVLCLFVISMAYYIATHNFALEGVDRITQEQSIFNSAVLIATSTLARIL